MPRIKRTTVQPITSLNELEIVIDQIATLQLKVEADIALHNESAAAADQVFKAQLKQDQEKMISQLQAAETYVEHNRETIIGEKQTRETKLSYYGYRKSPGVLKTLNTKWTSAKTILSLKTAGLLDCIKTTETLDKNAVKKNIAEPELPKYGLRMEYREDFWIEPKRAQSHIPEKIKN